MVFPIAGGTQDTGYEISNSLRFNDNDTAYLNRTRSSQSNTTGTFSVWTKMGNVGADNVLFGGHTDVNNRSYIYFSDPDGYVGIFSRTSGSADINFATNARYRDPSAWYHVVVAIDTTQGTEANRFKMYVNGEQLSSFSASSYPSQNASLPILNQAAQTVGGGYGSSAVSAMAEGYMADAHYIDGTQYAASDFGETDDNGVWIPKKFTGSFGTNGFKLEFQQTGTGTASASTIGADTSGNDNHLTSNNLAATDVTVDTPTNNFATVNSLIRPYSGESLSEGNLKATATHASVSGSFWGTIPLTNGKWYWECKITTLRNAHWIGVSDDLAKAGLGTTTAAARSYGIFYRSNGKKSIDETESNYGNTYAQGDIIGVALDMDNKNIYFSKNGTFQNSGDPTSGSTGTGKANSSALEDIVLPACMQDNGDATVTEWNFGNPSFSISSGNADANGYGNFEYSVPTNYYSLCTKNLAEYG